MQGKRWLKDGQTAPVCCWHDLSSDDDDSYVLYIHRNVIFCTCSVLV